MEWREQSTVSCEVAFAEAQRWVEVVTNKTFGNNNFRSALEDGVLLCDLINRIKPGIIKRVNRLSTPIAGLDNVNVFLKACGKLGLKEAQLFHPGDLQDLSTRVTVKHEETNRRLKNVLITIYWLGRKAQADPVYDGPYLNLRAFEGLLGIALSKALEDSTVPRGSVRDSGFGDSWYADKEELFPLQSTHRREDSLDSLDSVESRTLSISSDATLKGSSEGCGSDAEAELGFRMAENKDSLQYRRSLVVEPKTSMQFNQFLPSKDKPSGYVPAPLRRKRAERHEDNRRSWANPTYTEEDRTITSEGRAGTGPSPQNGRSSPQAAAPLQWAYEYESESGSDVDRPEPDLELDDLASRRFRSPSPVAPANYAVPMSPRVPRAPQPLVTVSNPPQQTLAYLSSASPSPPPSRRLVAEDIPLRDLYDDSEEDEDEDVGYADPVQDDLYARKVGLVLQPSTNVPYDKFLPKFWTPEEDVHVQKIKLGSQSRPWYRKMQGFSRAKSGSSSEDSDCDVSPWLCAATPARPQSDTLSNHPHAPEGPAHPRLLTAQSPHMQPHTVSQAHSYPHHTYPPHTQPRRDPSAGPRLIRCERGSFLGPECPDDPRDDPRSVPPDLENDDMFARRTRAFHGSTHSGASKRESPVSARPDAPQIRIVTQPRRGEPVLPDIERDDLLFRKLNPPRPDQPLSGAPDRFNAVPIPEPWALPPKLRPNLLCIPCPPASDEEPAPDRKGEEHPKTDDMLMRKLGVGHASTATQATPTVPSFSSEDDMRKWQAIREAGRQRYKKRLMVERLGF